jgi:hypothetical protein
MLLNLKIGKSLSKLGALKNSFKNAVLFWPTLTLIRVKGFLTRDPGLHNGDLQSFREF